jgi:hypothetical protein
MEYKTSLRGGGGDMYTRVKIFKSYICVAKKTLARCSRSGMVGGVNRYAPLCLWLPLVGCKIRLRVALVLLSAGSSSFCAFGRSSPGMLVSPQ